MLGRIDEKLVLSTINVFVAVLYLGVFLALGDEGIPRWLATLSVFAAGSAAGMEAVVASGRLPSVAGLRNPAKATPISVGASRRGI